MQSLSRRADLNQDQPSSAKVWCSKDPQFVVLKPFGHVAVANKSRSATGPLGRSAQICGSHLRLARADPRAPTAAPLVSDPRGPHHLAQRLHVVTRLRPLQRCVESTPRRTPRRWTASTRRKRRRTQSLVRALRQGSASYPASRYWKL